MGEKIKKLIKIIYRSVLKIIYPNNDRCIICDDMTYEGICYKCRNKIVVCHNKNELCIGYYSGVLRELILRFKYNKDFNSAEVLIELINEKVKEVDKDFILTYIPIGEKSMRTRGFNQCEYIAKEIGFINNLKVQETLKKVKETEIQKTLKKEERLKNIVGAFGIIDSDSIKNKKFILIDDVITTGATIEEGRKVLKEAGAKEIKILTLAKSHI